MRSGGHQSSLTYTLLTSTEYKPSGSQLVIPYMIMRLSRGSELRERLSKRKRVTYESEMRE